MKRLNVRLLVILAITFMVFTGSVVVVHGIQMTKNADFVLAEADKLKGSTDVQQMRERLDLFKRYVNYRKDDLERYTEYAMLAAEVAERPDRTPKDITAAYQTLSHVVEEFKTNGDTSKPEVRMKLVDLLLSVGGRTEARQHLLEMKTLYPADHEVDLKLAECEAAAGKYMEAVKLLQELVGYDPATKEFNLEKAPGKNEVEAYQMLAILLRTQVQDAQIADRNELADQVVEQMVANNPESAKAHLVRAAYSTMFGSKDAAKVDAARALELEPNDVQAIAVAIQMALEERDFTRADSLVDRGIEQHPKEEKFYLQSVAIAQEQGDLDGAKKRLDSALKKLPSGPNLLIKQFEFQLRDKQFEQARVTIKQLGEAGINPALREYFEAKVLVADGKLLDASRRIERVRTPLSKIGNVGIEADLQLMQCYQSLGQSDMALRAARRVLAAKPDAISARLGMAAALLALGKTDEALQEYEKIAAVLEKGNLLSKAPLLWEPLLQLRIAEQMRRPAAQRNWKKVDDLAELIETEGHLKQPQASLLKAQLLMQKGQIEEGRRLIEQLVAQYPDNPAVVTALTKLRVRDDPADALEFLASSSEALRRSPGLVNERIQATLARGGEVEELKKELDAISIDVEKMPAHDRERIYPTLAAAYGNVGDFIKARDLWGKIAELKPDDLRIRWLLFAAARDANDAEGMTEITDWFAKRFGQSSAQVKLAKASRMVGEVRASISERVDDPDANNSLTDKEREKLRDARSLLLQVKAERGDWHQWPMIMAEIDAMEGKIDDCIVNLREALKLGPNESRVVRHLFQLLHTRGRNEEALEVLNKYGSVGPDMWRQEVAVLLANGKSLEALERVEAMLPRDSRNPADHLLHGQMLATAGKTNEAEAAFRKAVELAPESSDAWLALIGHLTANGKVEHAKKAVEEAQIKLPEDTRNMVLARGYAAVGDLQQADRFFLAALGASPDDLNVARAAAEYYLRTGRGNEAKKLIDHMLASPSQAPTPQDERNLAWANRTSAKIKASTGDYQQFLAAMEMVKPKGSRMPLEDLMAQIEMLSNRPEPDSARQAIQLLESLSNARPLQVGEQLLLAGLYERMGNWPAAREQMLAALGSENPDPAIYATYIEMLLRHDGAREVGPWLEALRRASPSDSIAVGVLKARYDATQGRKEQAVSDLLKLLPSERPLPKDQWGKLRQVAGLLQSIGEYDEAEKLLRENMGSEPAQWLPLAAFLASRGKVEESLTLIDQQGKSTSPKDYLPIAFEAVRQDTARATPEQIERVKRMFESALRDDPESTQIELLYANLQEHLGNYDEVVRLYRRILDRAETPLAQRAIAANNLAYILVLTGQDADEAQKLIDQSIEFLGPRTDLLDTRGLVHLAKGDTKKAVEDLNDSVAEINPTAIKYLHLAEACLAARDYSAARRAIDNARQQNLNPAELPPLEKSRYQKIAEKLGLEDLATDKI